MTDKQFINGLFIDEHTFQDGGSIIKLTMTDALVKYYEEHKTVNGKGNNQLKVDLKRSKGENKLYAELNTFVPKAQEPVEESNRIIDQDDDGDIIPF